MKLGSIATIIGLTATSALALSACTGSGASDSSASSARGGTLTIASVQDVTSFDPAQAQQGHQVQYFQPAYDSLVRVDPDGSTIDPFLATKWEYDSTKTVLTMTIRTGVTFSDGTNLDASAIKTNLDRFRTGNGPNASTLADVKEVSAPNPTTLVITLKAPDPTLLNDLGNQDSFIASPKAIAAGHIATTPVGSGPYTYDASASVAGSKYVFNATKNYWDPSLQKFDQIVLTPISSTSSTLNALLSGQVDAAYLQPQTAPQASSAGMTVQKYNGGWEGLYILDRNGTTVPALANVKVRQAISFAIDKNAIIQSAFSGLGEQTSQLLPPNVPGYVKSLDNSYQYDLAKAKSLMQEAGYGNGFKVQMPASAGPVPPSIQAAIGANLAAIGITVDWVNVPSANYISAVAQGKFPMAWFKESQGSAWFTAQTLLTPTAVFNPLHTTDPKVESLIDTVQNGSTSQANDAATQLDTYVVDQAWFAPFSRFEGVFGNDSKVSVVPQQNEPVPYIYNYSPKG